MNTPTCLIAFPVALILLLSAIVLVIFAAVTQAKTARNLKKFPEDYRRMLVGGKSYLYIESLLSQGMPQAIQEQMNLFRYFRGRGYIGKFSNWERNRYLWLWYGAYVASGLFFAVVIGGMVCISGNL